MPPTTPNLTPQNDYVAKLLQPVNLTDTTIFIDGAVPAGTEGFLDIGEGLSSHERIFYNSKGSNFVTCPSVVEGRGIGRTSVTEHAVGETVKMKWNAEWWKALQDGSAVARVPIVVAYNPYKFSAWASNIVVITDQTLKVSFNTEEFDTGGNFDAATNFRFTAPVSGYYMINTQVAIGSSGMDITESCYISLYKNGSAYLRSQQLNGSGNALVLPCPQINKLVQLSAGDYLEVFATMVGSRNIAAGQAITWFSGHLESRT
jgi:hypothetical protein